MAGADSPPDDTPVQAAHIHAPPAGLPCINLGPWGRDYHQWLERVHMPYSFGVLPELVWDITQALLTADRSAAVESSVVMSAR